MVLDLLTLGGFLLFFAVLAALIATHDFGRHSSAGAAISDADLDSRSRNR